MPFNHKANLASCLESLRKSIVPWWDKYFADKTTNTGFDFYHWQPCSALCMDIFSYWLKQPFDKSHLFSWNLRKERYYVTSFEIKKLPKGQRARGLSSANQSYLYGSFHKFKHKSCSDFIFRISTKPQLQDLNQTTASRPNLKSYS